MFAIWLFFAVVTPGMDWRRDYERAIKDELLPDGLNIFNATGLFWIMMFIGFVGTIVISCLSLKSKKEGEGKASPGQLILIVLVMLVASSTAFTWNAFWENDKDEARYYNASTTFYTPTLDLNKAPGSMKPLLDGATTGDGKRCQLVGKHDVPSCIREGTLPDTNWEARTSSLTGATFFLSKKTGDTSGVSLMNDSVTYLYNKEGDGGKWTGIRDGSGKLTPMYGVVEWSGKGEPTECYFNRDEYNFNRAFGGEKMNNLVNLIAERYRAYFWDNNDIWGYCDGSKPVIVMPMKQVVNYNNRTVEAAAGVLILRGSQSGDPVFDFRTSVKSGELPGPVYPPSLLGKQREMLKWAAGRGEKNSGTGFGYEATDADAQTGNASEYLLRDAVTKRLYWVSPMTPTGDTQLFVAYGLQAADEMNQGVLNPLNVYVLDGKDTRQVSLDTLDNTVKQVIGTQDPAFIANGGKIVEYLPLNSITWQVYGERGGQPVYVITLPVTAAVKPTIATIRQDGTILPSKSVSMNIDPQQPNQPAQPSAGTGCDKPPAQMTEPELAQCLGKLADEYRQRHPS